MFTVGEATGEDGEKGGETKSKICKQSRTKITRSSNYY